MKALNGLALEALALRERFDEEPTHSDHVAGLALQIFDGMRGWHRYGDRARELLHAGAILHDIGWSQTPDGRGHHKWSAKLIRNFAWKHLTKNEVLLVAQIARYHRKVPPKTEHADFHDLSASARKQVMILGGILRIADALDRTHSARIQRAEVVMNREAIVIRVHPAGDWDAESTMFETKRDMLQLEALRPVLVEAATAV